MLKYVLRRYFEYITVRTPILSLLLAFLTFAIVLYIASFAVTYEYTAVDGTVIASDEHGVMFAAYVPDDFIYDKEYNTAFVNTENSDQKIRLSLLKDNMEKGERMLYFIAQDRKIEDDDIQDETVIEIVTGRITLTERIFGNFRR